ncbi:hypothetical protein FQN57_006943 [Myotisia sp. PD_48]|nr:hypothetical protein FQN57_006943 [Myotisia sp. PD_48]
MASFSFGFQGQDIDDDDESLDQVEDQLKAESEQGKIELQRAKSLDLESMLSNLPSQIAYNMLSLTDPTPTTTTTTQKRILIPRRELFDIRAQLMAEEDMTLNVNEDLISGLERGDLTPSVYEGGFKTWECATDLAYLLSTQYPSFSESAEGEEIRVIELGAGTAVPSLALFRLLLLCEDSRKRKVRLIFADYNDVVLSLVTLPNILLTFYTTCIKHDEAEGIKDKQDDSHLDIDRSLIDKFKQTILSRGITLSFISGAWSPQFVDLCLSRPEEPRPDGADDHARLPQKTLILASETIYSPHSLRPFSETLVSLLRRSWRSGVNQDRDAAEAYIAAKKVYFGVGGGVEEFLSTLKDVVGDHDDVVVNQKLNVESQGVGRTVLSIARK